MSDYPKTLEKFCDIAKSKPKDRTMAALIIDSPWLPGYAGIDMLDFFFDQQAWLDCYTKVLGDLPGVAFVPGSWAEFAMATEPSGWGVPIQWHHNQPPNVFHYPGDMSKLIDAPVPNPEQDGFMPAVLRQYERVNPILAKRGIAPKMAAARGPLAVASHLIGLTELLMATQIDAEKCAKLLDKTTELCIKWLKAQLSRMDEPVGVLVLDDIVGMMGPQDAEKFAFPYLKKIFDSFPGMIHVYHNDAPNMGILEGLSKVGIDVFNLSHKTEIVEVRKKIGPNVVLMGNIPPLDVLVRGTADDVRKATEELLNKLPNCGPLIVSPGGGVSPQTPIENLKAMVEVVRKFS